jgi:arabinogalactan oligomer / maltooligosaccharide transport system substrate-binding protein
MKSRMRWASALGALAIVVAACSSGGTGATPGTTGGGASGSAAGGLSGELELWHSYSSGAGTELKALNEALDKVKTANPGLNVKVTEVPFDQLFNKIKTSWAAGEPKPDMFIAPNDSLGQQARDGLLADLSAYEGQLQNISAPALAGSKVDGKLYEIPESLKAVALYYNKSKVQTPPATTDELVNAVKGGMKLALFDGKDGLYHNFGWWGAFGGKLMDDSGKCVADQGGVADAYKFLLELKTAGAALLPKYDDMANGFKSGKYDAIVDGPWALGGYKNDVKDNLGVAPMPAGKNGPAMPFLGVDGFYVNDSASNKDLAAKFALAMTSAESQTFFANTGGHIPANTTVSITDPLAKAFADAYANTFPRPQVKELDNFWGNFGDAQAKITEAGADPTTQVAAACAAMNKANNK